MSDIADTREKPVRSLPFGAPYVLTLAVIDGMDCKQIHRLNKARSVVGRDIDADFRIDDELISKEHFIVEVTGTVYTIIDLGSMNGTFLNDKQLKPNQRVRLKHSDEICLGETRLLFSANRFKGTD